MSFWIKNRKKGTLTAFSVNVWGIFLVLALLLTLLVTVILPWIADVVGAGGRLGPMYRTEANLVAIESAIRAYEGAHGELPPSGTEGLQLAIDEGNREVIFYPDEVLKDAWDRDYIYVNSNDYASEDSLAIKDARSGLYHNPGRYQLYSTGEDGKRSPEDGPMAGDRLNDDNINNWDGKMQWRDIYRRRLKRTQGTGEK